MICAYRYWTEHGEERICDLAMRDHYDGAMDEPHVFRRKPMEFNPTVSERQFRIVTRVAIGVAIFVTILAYSCSAHAQISADLDLGALIQTLRPRVAPEVTCGIATVGYRFTGAPGRKLRYAGDTYEIERDGDLELIADKRRKTYAVDGRSLPLEVWPRNEFGFREVPVK